jgi:hypothetical protein
MDQAILDEMPTPDGLSQLVVYQAKGSVWIGVSSPSGGLRGAIALHTGSRKRYLETTASIEGSWGLAWGGVSPKVVRVEVRNELGDRFPARILTLPPALGEEFRAAWGVAPRCKSECLLIGYDERGTLLNDVILRSPDRDNITEARRLERVHEVADQALRYLATVYESSSDREERRLLMMSMRINAHYIALVEREDIDDLGMMSWRDSIVARYIADVEANPWRPRESQANEGLESEDGHSD